MQILSNRDLTFIRHEYPKVEKKGNGLPEAIFIYKKEPITENPASKQQNSVLKEKRFLNLVYTGGISN